MAGTGREMAQKRRARRGGMGTGTTSLLMIFTLLCLATLAMLSLTTAKSDRRIKERSLISAQSLMAAEGEAARSLSEIDGALGTIVELIAMSEGSGSGYMRAALAKLETMGYTVEGDEVAFTVQVDANSELLTVIRVLPLGEGARYELLTQTQQSTTEWRPEGGLEVWQG